MHVIFLLLGTLGHIEKVRPNVSEEQAVLLDSFEAISTARKYAIYPDVCHYTGETGASPNEFVENWDCYYKYESSTDVTHFAVAGDSNAADVANGFRLNEISNASMSGSGCSLVPKKMTGSCRSMFTDFISYLNSEAEIDVLVLTNLFTQDEYANSSVVELAQFWSRFNGRIVFLHDTPRFPQHRERLLRGENPTIDLHYDNLKIPNDVLTYLQDKGFHTMSRNSLFCEINSCSYFSKMGDILISDARGEHLSPLGAKLFVESLVNALPPLSLTIENL